MFFKWWDFKSLNPSETQSWAQIEPKSGLALIRPIWDCLESFLSVADRLLADQLLLGDVNFENSNFTQIHYLHSMFISYLWSNLTLKIIPQILDVTNIKVFSKFFIISLWRLEPWREKTPRWLVFTKLKAIQNPGLHLSLHGSKQTQRPGFTWG